MRNIKFRAWDKEGNVMYLPKTIDGHIGEVYDYEGNEWHTLYRDDTDLLIMQFTELLDKNGKEIYEGDIVSFGKDYFDVDMLGKVYWYDKTAGFFIHRFDAEGQIEEEVLISDYDIEIIGNIYENPELLESEK